MSDKKNPTAVKVGSRIKQARKMAGFTTAAQLNEHFRDWSASRLGNYEAGISIPSPDDIERIAEVTGSSPCWITFGIGPIRSGHRDIQAIRHQNLSYLVSQTKQTKARYLELLKTLGLAPNKLQDLLDNPFEPIIDRYARRCEKFYSKPKGWIDEQHVESDPLCMNFPEDIRELMSIYSELGVTDRQRLLNIARVFSMEENTKQSL
ncbi:MAG: helix-turn-helix domain-containing protein [Gammaproteobacteria bacterium]|nr:helix-turn-helix domain-containing protein [Gammaproteobacteria bacterium]MDH5803124.1 helix-turn-helix domain-containing protein [Gammaproteobacteria bacterium]